VRVVYLTEFTAEQVSLLQLWGDSVRFWPRSWREGYLESEPADWWIEFEQDQHLVEWMLRWAPDTRIMRTLFD
jgi:hypothetical protein